MHMEKEKAKIGFVSLGCSKNQVNTERMMYLVREAGYQIVPEDIDADVMVINTCAFIESAKKESIDNILDVAWLKENRNLKAIVVTGCLGERYREQILEQMPEVDAVLGTGSYEKIVAAIGKVLEKKTYTSFEDKNVCEMGGNRILTDRSYSAYLKIGEGCNNRCTYCAIPLIRGVYRSRPMEELVKEAQWLEEQGVREINLIAQDTSGYGVDLYGGYRLAELIHKITEATEKVYIRVLYCYPDKITDELIREFRDNERLLKYIDLPIQHISDRVLKAMNRHGNQKQIRETIARLRREVPDITIRSTGIVGFPGESEEDFEATLEVLEKAEYDNIYSFIYSPRKGTPAAEMPDQIPPEVSSARFARLLEKQMEISNRKNKDYTGCVLKVLVEGHSKTDESKLTGRSEKNRLVHFEGPDELVGQYAHVRITRTETFALFGILEK